MQLYSSYTIDDEEIRRKFSERFKVELKHDLWYQPETNLFFGTDLTRRHMGKFNSVFTDTEEEFMRRSKGNGHYNAMNTRLLSKFAGAKVLLIGGGPSTDHIDWQPSDYDYLASCNNFYLNDKVARNKVDLIYINPIHNYPQLSVFVDYVKANDTIICTDSLLELQKLSPWLISMDYNVKIELRFNGRIGILPRLIMILCIAGARQVDIVGMDGVSPKSNVRYHSFLQKEVAGIGSTESHYKNWLDVVYCYQRNYIMFFDYLFNWFGPTTKLVNLAEDYEDNILAGISKVMF